MKMKHRILSMLLVLALVIGVLPAVAPTVVEAAVTDTPAGVRNHLPSTAKDVKYLSDMTWEYSINYQNGQTIKDGIWSNGSKIVLGAAESNGGTVFEKGLGVMPFNTNSDPETAARTIFDLADNNYAQSYFYAAAGLTNRNADSSAAANGVVFQVWASFDKTVEDYTQAEYVLLESSGTVQKGNVYQFHVDVTGVRYLKLVVYAVNAISSMNAMWAGACLYNNPGYYPKTDMISSRTKSTNSYDDGLYVPFADRDETFKTQTPTMFNAFESMFNTYNFNNLPSDAVYLATIANDTSKSAVHNSTTPGKGAGWVGGTSGPIQMADGVEKDKTWQKDGIKFPANTYLNWNVRAPGVSDNQTDGYVVYDISQMNVDTFYAIVGPANQAYKYNDYNPDNGAYAGMIFQVWGTYEGSDEFVLLAESEPCVKSSTGEFIVDITGVQLLKLRIQSKDPRTNASATGAFAYASVFNNLNVSVSGAASAMQGTEVDYTATIMENLQPLTNYAGTITWALEGATKSGTKLENGKLTVDPTEPAGTELKITASITEGGKTVTSAPMTVAVAAAPVYTLDIQGPAEAGKNTEHDVTTVVTKDGQPFTYDNITWELTGNTDPATKLENGKLIIGNEPVGTKLTVKASFTEYGITREDSFQVEVIAYAIALEGHTEMNAGGKIDLSATVLNEGTPIDGAVTWTIEGNGILYVQGNTVTVKADYAVGTIRVTATWTSPAGTEISATQVIKLNSYTIDIQGDATAVSKDSEVTLTAKVDKNGSPDANANVTWTIVDMLTGTSTQKTGATLNLNITEDVGSVLLVIASIEVGGQTITDTTTLYVTDYNLVIDPSAVEVPQGSVAELNASLVQGNTPVTDAVISWKVIGATGSALSTTGNTLKLTANDQAGTVLTVVAMATIDNKTVVSAPVTVTITAAPTYVVTITNTVSSVKQGNAASFAASVTLDGTAVTDADLIWFVTGKTAAGTAIDSNGNLVVDKEEVAGTKLNVTAAILVDGKLITSAAAVVNVNVAPQQDAYKPYVSGGYMTVPGGAIYLSADLEVDSLCLNNDRARYDVQWTSGSFKEIWLGGATGGTVNGDGGIRFYKGVAMQPFNPSAEHPYGEVYAIYDLSELDIDTFYAVVGLTNQAGQNTDENAAGAYGGIYYEVWATYEEGGEYQLIGQSDLITKTATGEFTVNVEGVQLLKLIVKCKNNVSGAHASMSGMWANACVYSTKVDSYVVEASGTANELKQGEELTFTATASKNGETMTDAVISWAVTGGTKEGTKIDANGKLTVDAAEAPGTKLTITASITVGENTFTSAPIEVTVKEAPQTVDQADAYKPSNGTYMSLPNGVIYLSDTAWTESINLSNIEAIKNGTYKNNDPIWLGGASGVGSRVDDGTKFDKGLGVMPFAPNDGKNGAAHTIWNVSELNVNTFYGVVGITNGNGQNYGYGDPYNDTTFAGGGVIFQVYGDFGDGVYKLLAESEIITKTMTGEFKVNIEGVKNLKLVVKCAMDGASNHSSMNSAWANACVYAASGTSNDSYSINATGTATNVQQGKNTQFTATVNKNGEALADAAINWAVTGGTKEGTKIDASGKLTIDKKEPAGTKLSVTASITVDGTTYTSAAVVITVDEAPSNYYQKDAYKSNSTGKYAEMKDNAIYLSDVSWIESVNLKGAISTKNLPWNGTVIYIGGEPNDNMTDGVKFEKGIGMQPQEPANGGNAWTIIDVSKLDCDTFYAAIGSTNKANQEFGHNSFIFQVYGATEKNGDFVLLAESEPITKTMTGEFTIDIKDMAVLKLVVKCTENGTHAYGNSIWANACVYNKDGSAGNPDGGNSGSDKPAGEKPAQEGAYTTFGTSYMTPSGTIIYLSDIDWTASNNLADIEAIRDGTYKNGDPIWLGGASGGKVTDGTKFKKGLGVMPFAPNDGKNGAADTIFDVSELNVNTFYGVVGITNANGQNYGYGDAYNDATFAGGGIIFQVFADYGDGTFKLLAESEIITKTLTGEFKVDITGVKLLKLVVKCNLDTGSGHTSMNAAWGNACVFNSETGSLEAGSTTEPTQPGGTTESTKPKPTRPATPTEPADDNQANEGANSGLIVIIAVGAVLLLAVALLIALIVRKNKKKRAA